LNILQNISYTGINIIYLIKHLLKKNIT